MRDFKRVVARDTVCEVHTRRTSLVEVGFGESVLDSPTADRARVRLIFFLPFSALGDRFFFF